MMSEQPFHIGPALLARFADFRRCNVLLIRWRRLARTALALTVASSLFAGAALLMPFDASVSAAIAALMFVAGTALHSLARYRQRELYREAHRIGQELLARVPRKIIAKLAVETDLFVLSD